ncbi:MAG: TetR/AcrR family transcriptional regulator [Proteobacteria bacterium]|nr:TetR/AcrR family transcriptional regulator [Pseudomonadota bacterium]
MPDSNSKKKRILQAAEKIMARKGKGAKISEIATEAGVFDSNIYHYFKNKEDLLFSVAGERTRSSLEELELQLQGIREPVSKLSKLIWWHLYRHEKFPEFSSIVLFQCRSRSNYYSHKAFLQIASLRIIFDRIIDEGVAAGLFRSDLKKPAVWNVLFGLMDLECIMCHVVKETSHTYSNLDEIMDLILPMITLERDKVHKKQDKTDRIIKAAERTFAEKGYEHTTVQDVARLAEVADGTIYDHFKNKEALLFSAIEDGFRNSPLKRGFNEHLISTRTELDIKTPLEKIERFIRYLFFMALIQPNFAKMFVLQGVYNPQFYGTSAFEAFRDYLEGIYSTLEEGKAAGIVRAEVDRRVFRNLVLGAFSTTALRWFLTEKRHELDKVKEIEEMVGLLTRAIINQPTNGG